MDRPIHTRRSNLVFAAGVVLILTIVGVGYLLILREPGVETRRSPLESRVPAAAPGMQLTRAQGGVQLRQGSGEWRDAAVGEPVQPGTSLRTGDGGSALLSYEDDLEVEVAADADVRWEEIDDDVARLVVREGLVIADLKSGSGRSLQVAADGTDAVTETRDGRVHVLADGKGNVQTAVTRGTATVSAAGEKVELQTGYETSVASGRPPTAPTLMPKSLLLKIKWPPELTTAKRRQLVVGTTNPGVRIKIGDTFAIADAKGQFKTVIELMEGSNEIKAHAVDVFGRTESVTSKVIELDTKAPYQKIRTDPGMWHKKQVE